MADPSQHIAALVDQAKTRELVRAGIMSGNISVPDSDAPSMGISESASLSRSRQDDLMRQVEAMRRARTIVVPTNDLTVRQKLRELQHPITLFGERAPGRRERLRTVMSRLVTEQRSLLDANLGPDKRLPGEQDGKKGVKKPVMYEGTAVLKRTREHIFEYSIQRAVQRVKVQRRKRERPEPGEEEAEVRKIQDVERKLKTFTSVASTVGDSRTVSSVSFQQTSQLVATGSWSGYCKIWNVENSTQVCTFQNHQDSRISDVAFHPFSGITQDEKSVNVASCDVDGRVYLWSLPSDSGDEDMGVKKEENTKTKVPIMKAITTLKGHTDRCSRLAFHPSGNFLASTGYDKLWILWDMRTQQAVLKQRGHSRALYGLAMQCDGSLVSTSDLGGNCRIWDLRSGKSIMPLRGGHSKQVLCMDFSPNGYHLATGSGDNTVRVWDLRKRQCLYTIPAHGSLVSSVRWDPNDGSYLATSGYDKTAKLWSATDFQLIKTLAGHEGKVTRAEISPDASKIITTSFDRTWKTWSSEEVGEDVL